jgi:translation initiation factor 5A
MTEKPVPIKDLKAGAYIMVDSEPCKVLSVIISKAGKHGSAKARIEAQGLFDNRKHVVLKPADADILAPIIEKKKAQIISIAENSVQLMDLEDYSIFEAIIPDELKGKLQPGQEIGYWKIDKKVLLKF